MTHPLASSDPAPERRCLRRAGRMHEPDRSFPVLGASSRTGRRSPVPATATPVPRPPATPAPSCGCRARADRGGRRQPRRATTGQVRGIDRPRRPEPVRAGRPDRRQRIARARHRPADRRQHRRPDGQHGEDGRAARIDRQEPQCAMVGQAVDARGARATAAAPDRHPDAGDGRALDRHRARCVPGLADVDRSAQRQGDRQADRPCDSRLGQPRAAQVLPGQSELAQGQDGSRLHQLVPDQHEDRRPRRPGLPGAAARGGGPERSDPRLRRRQDPAREQALQGSRAARRSRRSARAERALHHELAARPARRCARRVRQARRVRP